MSKSTPSLTPQTYDAAIVGGGPAGISCAVWLALFGFRPIVLEAAERVGGLCRGNPYADPWTVCLPYTATGNDIANHLEINIQQAGVPVHNNFRVERITPESEKFVLQAEDGRSVRASYVVIASGVRFRGLGSSAANTATTEGVIVGPGAQVVAQNFSGLRVAVLGGGDNAFENALYVRSKGAKQVDLYARTVRAQKQFVNKMPAADVYRGSYEVDVQGRQVNGRQYDLLMVFYGFEPIDEFTAGLALKRTREGFLYADPQTTETSQPGVYAIGEVTQRLHPCVVTALADGVLAAKAIQARLEA